MTSHGRVAARRLNLMLVEDDELDVMNLQRVFTKLGLRCDVTVASDGAEALELLRTGRVSRDRLVILLDLRMPRMSGLEFLAKVRADERLRDTPVVVLTTSADPNDRRAAYELNAAGYFVKPGSLTEYRELVASFARYWSTAELPHHE